MHRTVRLFLFTSALGVRLAAGRELYVAQTPGAADTNPGSLEQPYRTLGKACAEARAGDTVFIRSGTYREALIPKHSGEPDRPIVFQAFSNETVMIKGSIPLTGLEREDGDLWVVRPWTRSFWWDDAICRKISSAPYQESARQEQVFVDEEPLQWVPSREDLRPGSFFWNAAPKDGSHAGELIIQPPEGVTNLNAALVEIPVLATVVGAWPESTPRGWTEIRWARRSAPGGATATGVHPEIHHIHIRGLNFRHAAHTLNRAGVRLDGDHWVLEDCAVEYMNAVGVMAGGDHDIVRRCRVSHNGQGGISGSGSAALFEDVTTCYNNRKLYSISWGGAGNKFGLTREGCTVRRLVSAFNHGSGLWYDIDCVNVVVEDSLALGNRPINAGFFYEISWDGLFQRNVSFANHQPGSGFYGAAFVLSDSASTRVEDNVAIGGSGAFAVGASRGPRQNTVFEPERDWWLGRDNLVRNNLVVEPHDFTISVRRNEHYDSSRPEARNRFETNTYLLRHGAGHVKHGMDAYADPLALEAATAPAAGNRIVTDPAQLDEADRQRLNAAFTLIARTLKLAAPESDLSLHALELVQIWTLEAECRVIGYWLRDGDAYELLLDLPAAATLQIIDPACERATLWDFAVLKSPVRTVMENSQGLFSGRAEGPCALITGLTAGARTLTEVFGVTLVTDGQRVTTIPEGGRYEAELRLANPFPTPLDVVVSGPGLATPWTLALPADGFSSTNLPLVARTAQNAMVYEMRSPRLPLLRRAAPLRVETPVRADFWQTAAWDPNETLENPRAGADPLKIDRESQRVKALYDVRTGRAWKGPDDLSAEVRMGWNETGLFLSARVRDDQILPNPQAPYSADGVEVFLDGRTNGLGNRLYTAGTYQFLCAAPDPEIEGWQPLVLKPVLPGGPAGRARVVADGYELDIRIPWAMFPSLTPAPGAVMGVDLALDDADERGADGKPVRHTQLVWRGSGENWRDASLFGRLRLLPPAQHPDD